MAADDPRYVEVNQLHALGYPPITRNEAGRAARRLIREYGKLKDAGGAQERQFNETGLLRWWTDGHKSGARRVWVSPKATKGTHRGWGRLIHDVAHMVFRYRYPNFRPHDHGESQIETEIAKYVREQGWLNGTLKDKIAPKATDSDKIETLRKRYARWQTKALRAKNAMKKIERKIKYYERKEVQPS